MRTFDINAVLLDETFEGYKDWEEASAFYGETDTGGVCTPSIEFDPYSQTGQRKHLALTISNTTGSTQDVRFSFGGNGFGVWVHNTVLAQVAVTMQFRYQADAALDGATATFRFANSPFAGSIGETVVGDGTWRTVTGTWLMQVDANLFTEGYVELTDIPDGAEGVFRYDDVRLTRVGNILRVIDASAPVVALRPDWGDGFRESYGWNTAVHNADDGSEHREQWRLIPSCRLEYSIVTDGPARSGYVDQFLYRYAGQVLAVPRWADAVRFASTASSGHEIFTSDSFTSRWFQPRQRFMVWESETVYEVETIDTINTTRITLDPNEGAVDGVFTTSAWIVPLVPARLAPEISLSRPNGSLSLVSLAFDVQMVQ